MTSVPGAQVMAERGRLIRYDYHDLPRGGALRISTVDPIARKAVWEFLNGHPSVATYRLGEGAEGGEGATVVSLRT